MSTNGIGHPKSALIVVDVQNDFCPGGALAVPEGDAVVPVINRLIQRFDHVLLTQDWHPRGHRSFASSHPGREPYDRIVLEYGEQVLWPDHCVQGTSGAAFHPELEWTRAELVIRKGFRREIDSYSTFFENDRRTATGLAGFLKEREIDAIVLAGLATDFCVRWSAEDGKGMGFDVTVVRDAVRGIDVDGSVAATWQRLHEIGAAVVDSGAL